MDQQEILNVKEFSENFKRIIANDSSIPGMAIFHSRKYSTD
jgi:hypothetical protein